MARCFVLRTELYTSRDGYSSLVDGFQWLGSDVISNVCCLFARTLGAGYASVPPQGGNDQWISDVFMVPEWFAKRDQHTGPIPWDFYLTGKFDAGITGQFQTLKQFGHCDPAMQADLITRARSVDEACIPFNVNANHWLFALVSFRDSTITIVNSFGLGDENLYKIVEMIRHWAIAVKRVRGESDPSDFRIFEMSTRTQFDGFECGVHTICNILAHVCGWNTVLPHGHTHHSRLWISMLLWLCSTDTIQLSGDQLRELPEIVKPHVRTVASTIASGDSFDCTPCGNKQNLMQEIVQVFKVLCCQEFAVGPIRQHIIDPPVTEMHRKIDQHLTDFFTSLPDDTDLGKVTLRQVKHALENHFGKDEWVCVLRDHNEHLKEQAQKRLENAVNMKKRNARISSFFGPEAQKKMKVGSAWSKTDDGELDSRKGMGSGCDNVFTMSLFLSISMSLFLSISCMRVCVSSCSLKFAVTCGHLVSLFFQGL